MSWEAVTWANKQKLKKSYEQIVLLVLANCADPNGEAFVKWPGRDHWWVYLSERTRLPKSSLFRHLNTLVALGLGERTMQVLADGSRRPTFKLNLEAAFDIDLAEDEQRYNVATSKTSADSQSPVETGNSKEFDGGENDSDISDSQGEGAPPVAPQSPVGTENPQVQSPVGTDPFPVLRLDKDSIPVPKDSPLPPSGGLPVRDEDWDKFVTAWREPMPKMALARHAWDHIPTERRGEAVAAATGYFAWLGKHPKPPATVSAQSFLRDVPGFAQWLRYTPAQNGETPKAPIDDGFAADSPEGRAIIALHAVARILPFEGRKRVYYPGPITPQLMAFADRSESSAWSWIGDREQIAAWSRFLSAHVFRPRPTLTTTRGIGTAQRSGIYAPGPWPPTKKGKWPDGPTEDDFEALANEGQR